MISRRAALALGLMVPGCRGRRPDPVPLPPPGRAVERTPAPWRSLFDGTGLAPWKPSVFGGDGAVRVEGGKILLLRGDPLTGIAWAGGALPRVDYEVALEAMKLDGSDFFCCLTFPVAASWCSLVVGGWGGGVVGLSSLDGLDASENETSRLMSFARGRWYGIRVAVAAARIRAWIDDAVVVDAVTSGRTISLRPEVELSRPLGIATYRTSGALRALRLRETPS